LKYFVTILLLSLSLFAGEFTKLTIIKPNMPISLIRTMIESAEDGTVIEFQGGKYNFSTSLVIQSKNDIALRGEKNSEVILNGLIITFNNINTLNISHLILQNNSVFVLKNIQKFDLGLLNLNNSQIGIYKKSLGIVHDSTMSLDKNAISASFYMDNTNSTVIENVTFDNHSLTHSSIYSKNSSFIVKNSKLVSEFYISILSVNSKVFLYNNIFNGKYPQAQGFHRAVDIEKSSQLIASNNSFSNYYIDLYASKALLQITNNKFHSSTSAIFLSNNNQGTLDRNIFSSNVKAIQLAKRGNTVEISNSSFIGNDYGISILSYSEADTYSNTFRDSKKMAIVVADNAAINIVNPRYTTKSPYYCYAAKHSKIYVADGYSDVRLDGLGDPQVQDSAIYLYIKKVDFSTFKFNNIKKLNNIPFYLSSKLIKGYLQEPIIINNNYGNKDKINVGTYIIFDKATSTLIVAGKELGKHIENIPHLAVKSTQRSIEITPIIDIINTERYISFLIKSNIVLNQITFDNSPLQIKYMTIDGYKTLRRNIKNIKVKTYKLTIGDNNFILHYNCNIFKTHVKCILKKKLKF